MDAHESVKKKLINGWEKFASKQMATIDHHIHIKKNAYDLVELAVINPRSGDTHSIDLYWIQVVTALHALKLKLKLKGLKMGKHCPTKFLNRTLQVRFSTKKWLNIIEETITQLEYKQIMSDYKIKKMLIKILSNFKIRS